MSADATATGPGGMRRWRDTPHPERAGVTLDKETVLAAIRECVTVVKPGETLAVRARDEWTPMQMRELQEAVDSVTEYRDLGFRVLVVPGAEFAVIQDRPDPA